MLGERFVAEACFGRISTPAFLMNSEGGINWLKVSSFIYLEAASFSFK